MLKRSYMIENYEQQKRKRLSGRKSLMDYSIGILIAGMGVFFFFRNKLELDFNESFPPNEIDKVFGVVCLLYGSWRIYRGYKKNYFR